MNEDHDVTLDHPGAAELAGRLDAFASARLVPNRVAMQRIRAGLIEEARVRSLEASIGRSRHRHGIGRSRVAAVFLAAAMTLGGAVAALATTGPGGPLYGARIWLETATLPADPDSRSLERIHQIEERLVEAERAAAAGDAGAVAAAIHAYRDAVDAAVADAGTDVSRLEHLQAALGLHVAVLEALAKDTPGKALGLQQALEASQQAVDRIEATTSDGQGPDSSNGSGSGGKGGEPTDRPSPEPAATPKPGKTPDPAATPRPQPSHDAGGGGQDGQSGQDGQNADSANGGN